VEQAARVNAVVMARTSFTISLFMDFLLDGTEHTDS
jgi:hypothetical protein